MTAFPKPVRASKEPKPLRRRTWMRKGAPKRLKRAGSDPAYLDKVRGLPCYLSVEFDCEKPIHAHHAIHRSQGGKDDDAIPLCQKHHRDWHECTGPFRGLNRLERFAWAVNAIAETRRLLGAPRTTEGRDE